MTPSTERAEPVREEVAAARQVVDLFATEALLALDRYQRSLPPDAPDRAQQTADRLAHWWRELDLDDLPLDRAGGDAEQILVKAADLCFDPENREGLDLDEAAALANTEPSMEGREPPTKRIADFRKQFEQAYGGRAGEPANDDTWLAESLTRLARANLLRTVVESGARVRVSEPLRQAADVLVEQGRQLTGDRLDLARSYDRPIDRSEQRAEKGRLTGQYALASLGVNAVSTLTGSPTMTLAAHVPLVAAYIHDFLRLRRDQQEAIATQHDPAQDQLRFDRGDMVNTLGTAPPATRRDLRAVRDAANRRNGPGR
ncbi:hypothetical protein [Kribbella sp. NPDC003557]|uniref:hypothetical protein n=1 Tax=Kribbella sp. NPDC003557 TaxID=3154449 RepID=UPI0033BDCEE3